MYKIKKCECKNVNVGSYDNVINKTVWWGTGKVVCIDRCIYDEIMFLWSEKIMTSGCCCGHGKQKPMINVFPEWHNRMIDLGYKFWTNEFGTICYEPKSIIN